MLEPDHPLTLDTAGILSHYYLEAGRPADALKVAEDQDQYARCKAKGGPDGDAALTCQFMVARALLGVKRPDDAVRVMQDMLAGRRRAFPTSGGTQVVLWRVASSLDALGRTAEAAPLLDECIRWPTPTPDSERAAMSAIKMRMGYYVKAGDVAGCRALAELWEGRNRTDTDSLWFAAAYRCGVSQAAAAAGRPSEAAAEAGRAMGWVAKMVAAGYTDRKELETDDDLALLRGRADFRALAATLPEVAPPPRPAKE